MYVLNIDLLPKIRGGGSGKSTNDLTDLVKQWKVKPHVKIVINMNCVENNKSIITMISVF